MRLRWKSIIPLLGVVGAWLASPEALKLVSDEHAHYLLAVSSLIAVLTPALLTNKPRTDHTAERIAKRQQQAGVADPTRLNQFRPADDE